MTGDRQSDDRRDVGGYGAGRLRHVIAGDLVFHDRAPSTPHADLARWRTSLDTLKARGHRDVTPGHGPVDRTPNAAIDQTRDWLDWPEPALRQAVAEGRDMVAAGDMPIPPRFAGVNAARYELQRSVSHLYPALEAELLPRIEKGIQPLLLKEGASCHSSRNPACAPP